jgi:hypothetical protein
VFVENAGDVEQLARRKLWRQATSATYVKDGSYQEGKELLRCSFTQAFDSLLSITKERGLESIDVIARSRNYEFKDAEEEG